MITRDIIDLRLGPLEDSEDVTEGKLNRLFACGTKRLGTIVSEARKAKTGPEFRVGQINGRIARFYKWRTVKLWSKKNNIRLDFSPIKKREEQEHYIKEGPPIVQYTPREDLRPTLKAIRNELAKLQIENENLKLQTQSKTPGLVTKGEILQRSQTIRSLVGIYFLIQEDEIVYVGQSVAISARVASHHHEGRIKFEYFSYITVDKKDLLAVESAYIITLNPKHNVKTNKHVGLGYIRSCELIKEKG